MNPYRGRVAPANTLKPTSLWKKLRAALPGGIVWSRKFGRLSEPYCPYCLERHIPVERLNIFSGDRIIVGVFCLARMAELDRQTVKRKKKKKRVQEK